MLWPPTRPNRPNRTARPHQPHGPTARPARPRSYPRLLIENRIYCSRVFRKLHVEVAVRQDGLQVLHVVLCPRYR